jgi:hypothetical protein
MLSQLLQTDLSTHLHIQICEKLLRVSTIVLSWDFSSKFIIYQYHLKIVMGGFKSSTFRPPASWSEFFANGDILVLFMQVGPLPKFHYILTIDIFIASHKNSESGR